VVVGPWGRHDAPARHGSAARQTDVRGFPPQLGRFAGRCPALASRQCVAGGTAGRGSAPQRRGATRNTWNLLVFGRTQGLELPRRLGLGPAPDRLGPHQGHYRHQWFGILPAHRSHLAIRPRRQRGVAAARSAAWPHPTRLVRGATDCPPASRHASGAGLRGPLAACSAGHSHSHSTGHNCNQLERTGRNLGPT
jgi:hypothetical protein